MKWTCEQTEARLSDYLDGTLSAAEQEAAETHVAACARCAEWRDARLAVAWLRRVEPLHTPPGLETRILARTTGLVPRLSAWEILLGGVRALRQPRMALSVAAALFSISLVFQALDINVRELRASDFRPSNIYRKVERTANVAYGRSVKFMSDLRLVYEIRSRLDALKPAVEQPAEQPPTQPPRQEKKEQKNFSDDGALRTLMACYRTNTARYTR